MVRYSRFSIRRGRCTSLFTETCNDQANFPNLRRLFIEARTDNEEREVSRKAV